VLGFIQWYNKKSPLVTKQILCKEENIERVVFNKIKDNEWEILKIRCTNVHGEVFMHGKLR